jgi:hypothetical protein
MDKSSFYRVKNRASTNLKKVKLHLYISLRKRYTYKTCRYIFTAKLNCCNKVFISTFTFLQANTSKLEMPKIVSVETLKKQENDFITRVVLRQIWCLFLEFSHAINPRSRALHAYVSRACVDGSPLCCSMV